MRNLLKKIDNKYVRLTAFILIIVNDALHMLDIQNLPFTGNEIAEGVSIAGTIIIGGWIYWKNNSYTEMAKNADEWLEKMKKRVKNEKKKFKQGGG